MIGKKSPERSVTEVRLVEAAAQLFARHGFKATTTREIAQLAALNEATLFRYFPRKPDLFLAALESHLNRVNFSHDLHTSLVNDDDPEVVLPKLVAFFLNVLNTQPELRNLLHVAGFELPEAQRLDQSGTSLPHIRYPLRLLQEKFRPREAIARIDPQLAVFGLLGAVSAHHLLRAVFTSREDSQAPAADRPEIYVN